MLEAGLLIALLVTGMLAVGTASEPSAVRARLVHPRPVVVAVVLNAVVVPALALLALTVVDAEPGLALGVLLCAAAPGGGTGALLSHHARGDAPFAVVLQAVLAVVALGTAPLWVAIAGDTVGLPVREAVTVLVPALLLFQVLPVAAGSALRARAPAVAAVVHAWSRRAADLLLLTVVVLLTARNVHVAQATPGSSFLLLAGVVVMTLAVGSASGLADRAASRAVLMTTGVRNLSLALLLAEGTEDGATATVLTYGLLMYVGTVGLLLLLRRKDARETSPTPA